MGREDDRSRFDERSHQQEKIPWNERVAAVRRQLGIDLSDPEVSMGWEVFVLAHVYHEINILLFPVLSMAGDIIREVTPVLIPAEFNPRWPIIVVYHLSSYSHTEAGETGGHYEVIRYHPAALSEPATSLFYPHHIAYPHLCRLVALGLSSAVQDAAREAMVAYDARHLRVRVWAQDDVVGVSTRSLKRTVKLPAHNIVGVVAQVVERGEGHPAYRVLTTHGMINTLCLPTPSYTSLRATRRLHPSWLSCAVSSQRCRTGRPPLSRERSLS